MLCHQFWVTFLDRLQFSLLKSKDSFPAQQFGERVHLGLAPLLHAGGVWHHGVALNNHSRLYSGHA